MQDALFLSTSLVLFALALAGLAVVLRIFGVRPTKLLSRAEWIVLAKLVGTLVLGAALLVRYINEGLAPEIFIYGRF